MRRLLLLALFAAQLNGPHLDAQRPAPKNVLVLLPDPPGRPLSSAVLSGIESEMRTHNPDVAISADYVSQIGEARPEFNRLQMEWYRSKYLGVHFDAIVPMGTKPLIAATRLRNDLWPDVPIVSCGADADTFHEAAARDPNLTGFISTRGFSPNLRRIQQLLPDMQRIAFVGGGSPSDHYFNASGLETIHKVLPQMEVINLVGLTPTELLSRVASLPPHTVIIVRAYFYDTYERPVFMRDLVSQLTSVANAPLFESSTFSMGVGNVGGYLSDYERVGREIARLVAKIAHGEKVADHPAVESDSDVMLYDWRQLQKWNIPLSRLPAGSEVLYRPTTFWQRYGWWIPGVLFESILIAVLLFERYRARKSETEARTSRETISHMNRISSMGEMAASLAHELNQPLAGILSNAHAAQKFLNRAEPDVGEVSEALTDIQDDAVRAGDVIRKMRAMVRKETLASSRLDLNAVVRDALALLASDAQLRRVELQAELSPENPQVRGDEVQLQQVVLNLVLNAMEAMKESAIRGTVTVRTTAAGELSVSDTGPGIPPAAIDHLFQPFFSTKPEGLGMGLSISKSIVEAHGGRISVETRSTGATFRIMIPSFS